MMDALARSNQLREFEALQPSVVSLFDPASVQWPEGQQEPVAVAEWAPPVDVSEDDKEYLINVELPGVKKEAVKITAQGGTLTITGERRFERAALSKKYRRVERTYGSFGCRFSLPQDANPAEVSTESKDGVLKVHLAKTETIKTQPDEVADEITAWWQKALGTKAVLGQASNRPSLGPRTPAPKLLWTKPQDGQDKQEETAIDSISIARENEGPNTPRSPESTGHLWSDRILSALGLRNRRVKEVI